MDLSTLGGWLISALILVVQGTMVYGFVRLLWVGGGIHVPNPFQRGWCHLYTVYGSPAAMPPISSASARIGAVTYKNLLDIGFGEREMFLRKNFFSNKTVKIPYAHFTVLKLPTRTTVLLIPVRTDGLFQVDGVTLSLQAENANQLIARINGTPLPDEWQRLL